ncbi:MAG: transglycosylase domain-containing protein [Pseudomonadota bacterium]
MAGYGWLMRSTPDVQDLRKAKLEKPSRILAADGSELALLRQSTREWVELPAVSAHVIDALIATEDHRFRDHKGIDVMRTLAAAVHTASGDTQGGSTITQQLARNVYPMQVGRAQTLLRKAREAATALKIEGQYSKDEILETYLNTVPFLYGASGIEMGARTYFGKSARDLDVLQSATLVGMLKGTRYYNPVLNPERSRQRRNTVLAQMARHGKLDPAVADTLKQLPLQLEFKRHTEPVGPAPHFTQQTRKWITEWAERTGHNLNTEGLVIRTTLDMPLQALAEQAVERQTAKLQTLANAGWSQRSGWGGRPDLLNALVRETSAYRAARKAGLDEQQASEKVLRNPGLMSALREEKTRLQAGFLAMNPANGRVLAWVGSRGFSIDQFDHVQVARRQPGSTFKPFAYATAFEQGATPSDGFIDQVLQIPLDSGGIWSPTDVTPPTGLGMSLRDGLVYSRNTITAQVVHVTGAAPVASLARAMGVRQSKLDPVPSLALGTSPVSLREMVTAYSTLANDGQYREPVTVSRIEDRDGKVLESFGTQPPEQVLSANTAQTVVDVLRAAVNQGTATSVRRQFGIRGDVAGKTGTTQDNTDGWFVLMHPQLVAGAWVGYNDNRLTMREPWGQGAKSALPLVGDFFRHAIDARLIDARARFAAPEGASLQRPVLPSSDGQIASVWRSNLRMRPGLAPLQPAVVPMDEEGPFSSPAEPMQRAQAQAFELPAPFLEQPGKPGERGAKAKGPDFSAGLGPAISNPQFITVPWPDQSVPNSAYPRTDEAQSFPLP